DIISDDRRATEVINRTRRLLKKTDFVRLPVSLNDLVTNTIGLVANDALLHSVAIQFLPAPALPVTFGDHVQIQQVILNLLTNAIAAAWIRVHPARSVLWPLLQPPRPAAFHHTLVERRRRGPHRPSSASRPPGAARRAVGPRHRHPSPPGRCHWGAAPRNAYASVR